MTAGGPRVYDKTNPFDFSGTLSPKDRCLIFRHGFLGIFIAGYGCRTDWSGAELRDSPPPYSCATSLLSSLPGKGRRCCLYSLGVLSCLLNPSTVSSSSLHSLASACMWPITASMFIPPTTRSNHANPINHPVLAAHRSHRHSLHALRSIRLLILPYRACRGQYRPFMNLTRSTHHG